MSPIKNNYYDPYVNRNSGADGISAPHSYVSMGQFMNNIPQTINYGNGYYPAQLSGYSNPYLNRSYEAERRVREEYFQRTYGHILNSPEYKKYLEDTKDLREKALENQRRMELELARKEELKRRTEFFKQQAMMVYNNLENGYNTNQYQSPYSMYNARIEQQKKIQNEAKNTIKVMQDIYTMLHKNDMSKEELEHKVNMIDPNFRREMKMEEDRQRLERIAELEKRSKPSIVTITRGDKEYKFEVPRIYSNSISGTKGYFSLEDLDKVSKGNDGVNIIDCSYINSPANMENVQNLITNGVRIKTYPVINANIAREMEEFRNTYGKMSLLDFFNNAGHLYAEMLQENLQQKMKVEKMKGLYDKGQFRESFDKNILSSGPQPNYFNQKSFIDKNDLEIRLPNELQRNDVYMERRRQFIDKIMENARRVGTDITMGGNVNPMEVYNSD